MVKVEMDIKATHGQRVAALTSVADRLLKQFKAAKQALDSKTVQDGLKDIR